MTSMDFWQLAWQNARLNGRMIKLESAMSIQQFSIPFSGTLEVDFVDIRKVKSLQVAQSKHLHTRIMS